MTTLPLQPLILDAHGRLRFRANALVEHLLERHPNGMNALAMVDAPQEDREQFAQLTGYSLSGFGELSYVRNETYARAEALAENPAGDPREAHIQALEAELAQLRGVLRQIMAMAEDPSQVELTAEDDPDS